MFFFFGAVLDNSSLVELARESDLSGGAEANCGAIICTGEDLIPYTAEEIQPVDTHGMRGYMVGKNVVDKLNMHRPPW